MEVEIKKEKILVQDKIVTIQSDDFLRNVNQGPEHWGNWVASLNNETGLFKCTIALNSNLPIRPNFEKINLTGFDLSFKKVNFSGAENLLYGAIITGAIEFIDCENISSINIFGQDFKSIVFENTQVEEKFFLTDCNIQGHLRIENCKEFGGLDFSNLTFRSNYNVKDTVMFFISESKFSKFVNINIPEMTEVFGIEGVIFEGNLTILESGFLNGFHIVNSEMKSYTNLKGTSFKKIPIMHGSKLHQNTIFPDEEKFDVPNNVVEEEISSAIAALRTLRAHAAKTYDKKSQGIFFSLEQRYRELSGQMEVSGRVFSKLYAVLSDYGRSIGRPLYLLVFSMLSFVLIFALLDHSNWEFCNPLDCDGNSKYLIQSLKNTFLPFRSLTEDSQNILVTMLNLLQSIISVSAFYLFGLGARWLFKRD